MFFFILILNSYLSLAKSAQWTLDTESTATVLVGVGAAKSDLAVAAASDNGVGAFVEKYRGIERWSKAKIQAGLLLDGAITTDGKAITLGIFKLYYSNDSAESFYALEGLRGASLSVNVFGDKKNKFAAAGTWFNDNSTKSIVGVAYSDEVGKFSVSSPIDTIYPRYGAYPSDNVWYVSCGTWGEDPTTSDLSGRIKFGPNNRITRKTSRVHVKETEATETGWFGSVYKTADGGKTWKQVLLTDLTTDYIYFNGISCSTELNCVVVGEGDEPTSGGSLTVAYTTTDGGETWQKSFSSNDFGLMAAKFVSETDVWIAGTGLSGRHVMGQFYYSSDSGTTFTLVQSLDNCYVLDIDFADGVGFASCSSSSGSTTTVAIYK